MDPKKLAGATDTALAKQDENVLVPMIKRSIQNFSLNVDADKWGAYLYSAITANPKLGECTPASIIGGLMTLAAVNLPPVGGMAYLIPYDNKKTNRKEAHAQFGYKGLCQIFYRDQVGKAISAHEVYQKEIDNGMFSFDPASSTPIVHKRILSDDKGPIAGYYAIAQLSGGVSKADWMTVKEIKEHANKHSKGINNYDSPWKTAEVEMSKKTVMTRLTKTLPMSFETRRALELDETTKPLLEGIKSVNDLPNIADWTPPADAVVLPENASKGEEVKTDKPEAPKQEEKPKEPQQKPKLEGSDTLEAEIISVYMKENKKGGHYFAYKVDDDGAQYYVNVACKADAVAKGSKGDGVVFSGLKVNESDGKKFRWADDMEIVVPATKPAF